MAATIEAAVWLDYVRREYLDEFIGDGGSSIKFAVAPDQGTRSIVSAGLQESAAQAGYLVAVVDAEHTKIQMMDQLFFRIAEQIPWTELSRRVLSKLAVDADYAPTDSDDGSRSLAVLLAEANGLEPPTIKQALRPLIQRRVTQNRKLARDFRVAASYLCLAELSGGDDGEVTTGAITDWITGRNRVVAAVRPYSIFTRIHRTNARHLFASLLRWVRFAGYNGLVVIVDTTRVTLPSNPRDGSVFYTKAAMFDAYEVLRQFIDATDEMKGLFMVLLPDTEFLDQDSLGRGIGAYLALKARVFDEVRDQNLVNPMTFLVRIAPNGGAA